MTMIRCNVPPYEGTMPFVFFSFAPKDKGLAYPMLERMNQQRVRVWYDTGDMPAAIREKTLAEKLKACSVCVFLQTEQASGYHFCRIAAMNAYEMKKPMLPLLYDGDELTLGMRRLFDKSEKLECPALPEDDFTQKLCSHSLLKPCLGAEVVVLLPQEYHLNWEEVAVHADVFDHSTPPKNVPVKEEPVKKAEPVKQQEPVKPVEPMKPAEPVQPVKKEEPVKKAEPVKPVRPAREDEDPYNKTIPDASFHDDMDETIPDAPATLPVIVHLASGRIYRIQPGETLMGRSKECGIHIPAVDKSLSRKHARLLLLQQVCSLQDLNSTNGTFLDGKKLEKDAVLPIEQDAEVRLAHDSFFLALPPRSEKLWKAAQLASLQSAKTLETRYFFQETCTLGRSQPWAQGAMTARNISHQHARLEVADEGCTLTDLGSTNGTYVNKERIEASTPVALTPGDRIVMGDETLIFNCIPLQKEDQA